MLPTAHIEDLRGEAAPPNAPPSLLVEVPHGADRMAHYQAVADALAGPLPRDLHHFFCVNTDVGAWQLGLAAARAVVELRPDAVVRCIRCLVPRTFIDTNRVPEAGGALAEGGVTPGLQPYIREPADQALLRDLHAAYTATVEAAYAEVCGAGGLAFIPHTYGPVTMGIDRVDEDIVAKLHWALAPERATSWPVRAEVDLIHADAEGRSLAPPGSIPALRAALSGIAEVEENGAYWLHPSTMGARWSTAWPGQVLTLEVRRDLLVRTWTPFAEMEIVPDKIARFAAPIAAVLASLSKSARASPPAP